MYVFLAKLSRSRNQLAHRVNDHIVELGLSVNELLLMWTILEDERYTAAAIRRRLGMRQSTYDRAALDAGLDRLSLLTSLLPEPELLEDGLPAITA